jgi:D-3-phosphoglycerate dehydrogenase
MFENAEKLGHPFDERNATCSVPVPVVQKSAGVELPPCRFVGEVPWQIATDQHPTSKSSLLDSPFRMHQVLITDAPWGDCDIERAILEPAGCELVLASASDEQSLISLASQGDVVAIAACWARVTDDVIATPSSCRHIARYGIGLDNIDISAASARGMIVTNVPDYCVEEVAHHALALLLAHSRQIGFFHGRLKRGEYDLQSAPPMYRLSRQTLGLLGFGRTAQRLRNMALGIGLSVIAHSPSGDDYGTGCEMVPWEELLRRSDFLSLHAPLTDETRHIVDASALAQMKPSAVLINTARGGLVDETAVQAALDGGRLVGAGLDVFDPEPPDLTRPLFQNERVIATPHAAFVSQESLVELRERVAHQVLDVLSGREPEHVVNA